MSRRRKTYSEESDYSVTEMDEQWVGTLDHKEKMEPETRNGIVCNSSLVRVRDDPSDVGGVIKVLDNGDEVKIIGVVENRFYKIQLDKDTIGYISCKFCKEV